jgi:hypothetical protein
MNLYVNVPMYLLCIFFININAYYYKPYTDYSNDRNALRCSTHIPDTSLISFHSHIEVLLGK